MDEGKEVPQEELTAKNLPMGQERQTRITALWALRNEIDEQCESELAERIRSNPSPTDIEKKLGTYMEELEPQVREPVLEFNRKGYMTGYAGFHGEDCSQQISGYFRLDDETIQRLNATGVSVEVLGQNIWAKRDEEGGIVRKGIPEDATFYTALSFHPESADIQAIGDKWEQAADILPDRGEPSVNWYPEYRYNEDIINWKD